MVVGSDPLFKTKNWIPFTEGCFVPSLIEICPLVLEKIYQNIQCIFTLLLSSLFGDGGNFHFNNFESPSP
jgi:hypothetical protein